MEFLSAKKRLIIKVLTDYQELSSEILLLIASSREKYGWQHGYDILKEMKENRIIKTSERSSGSGAYKFSFHLTM